MIVTIVGCLHNEVRLTEDAISDPDFILNLDYEFEDDNEKDKNAVKILHEGKKLGYVTASRSENIKFRKNIEKYSQGAVYYYKLGADGDVQWFQIKFYE